MGKDQTLVRGEFFPRSNQNILYRLYIKNTIGFLKEISLFSILIGFFSFFLIGLGAFIPVILTWPLLTAWLLPRHYRYLQLDKQILIIGVGSLRTIITSRFTTLINLEKYQYGNIHHIAIDRWVRKNFRGKSDSFGRVEVKIDLKTPFFQILLDPEEIPQLIKVLDSHNFHSKVLKKHSRREFLLIFPHSPRFQSDQTKN